MRTNAIVLFYLFVITILIVSCEGIEGPQGPAGTPSPTSVYITGHVTSDIYSYPIETTYAEVAIGGASAIPAVSLNDVTFSLEDVPYGDRIEILKPELPFQPGDPITLSVNYIDVNADSCTAWADIVLPEEVEFTSHDPVGINDLPIDSDLSLVWNASFGADYYDVYLNLVYGYIDTVYSGYSHEESHSVDTLITDTSLTFLAPELFANLEPGDDYTYHKGYLYIMAYHGPWQTGELGNITGDATGFFYGRTRGTYLQFEVTGLE